MSLQPQLDAWRSRLASTTPAISILKQVHAAGEVAA